MHFWTIQHKSVLEILLKKGTYAPDFNESSKNKYEDMKTVYPLILNAYNERNNNNLKGLIFGFGEVNGRNINDIDELYNYITEHTDVVSALDCWNKDYCILKVEVNDDVDLVKIDFNDFIKLAIYEKKDFAMIYKLETDNFNYSFKEDIKNIMFNFCENTTNPKLPSFTQVHYSHLDKNNIKEVHNNINYENGDMYELNNIFKDLKQMILG